MSNPPSRSASPFGQSLRRQKPAASSLAHNYAASQSGPDLHRVLTSTLDEDSSEEKKEKDVKELTRALDLRVMLLLILSYSCSYIDRSNLSNSLTSLEKSIDLTPKRYALSAAFFTLSLVVSEIPSNVLLSNPKLGGARVWLAVLIGGCGVCSILEGCVGFGGKKGWQWMVAIRGIMGIFEGGVFPGMLFTLTTFYPPSQLTLRISSFTLAASISFAIGSFLAGILLPLKGGWRILFWFEGVLTLFFAALIYFRLPSSAAAPNFLTVPQRTFLLARLPPQESHHTHSLTALLPTLLSPITLILSFGYFLIIMATTPAQFLPKVLQARFAVSESLSNTIVGWVYVLGGVGQFGIGVIASRIKKPHSSAVKRGSNGLGHNTSDVTINFEPGGDDEEEGTAPAHSHTDIGKMIEDGAGSSINTKLESSRQASEGLTTVWRRVVMVVISLWLLLAMWEMVMQGGGVTGLSAEGVPEVENKWIGGWFTFLVGVGLRLAVTMVTPTLGFLYLSTLVTLPSSLLPALSVLTACVVACGNLAGAFGPSFYSLVVPPYDDKSDHYRLWLGLSLADFGIAGCVIGSWVVVEGVRKWASKVDEDVAPARVGLRPSSSSIEDRRSSPTPERVGLLSDSAQSGET